MTVEEVTHLASDRRSLPTRQPVAGAGTIRILVNDEAFIPQGGLFSTAHLYSTVSGPFDMKAGEDVLTVTTSKGSFTMPFGIVGTNRLTTDQVIKALLKKNFDVALPENINGHLSFTDITNAGLNSYVYVEGTATDVLGFGTIPCGGNGRQRGVRGRRVYPGWGLFSESGVISKRYPKFNEVVKNNPVLKVTYTTPVSRCLRCRSTFVENDIRFATNGQAILIENENLLYQAALKILLTDRGSNPYHPWYGTTLRSRIGTKAISGVAALISEDVRRTLLKLQNLQESQSKYQTVSFKERLYAVLKVETVPHAQDPTTFMVDVIVQNASSEPINLSIIFTVPDVVALMGSNGLMLGTEAVGLGQSRIAIPNSPVLVVDGS